MVYLLLLSLLCVISASADNLPCGDGGWIFFEGGHKCIKVNDERKTWTDAQSACSNDGGRLLTIPDEKTQNFLNQQLDESSFWFVGLSDIAAGVFKWIDGSLLCGYTNWNSGEPNGGTYENCVELRSGPNHHWNDVRCSSPMSYICEKRGPGCEYMNGGCPGSCTDATDGSWGVECSCEKGYVAYNGACHDVNECSVDNGGCDTYCDNTDGSYECSCNMDYIYNGTHCIIDDGDTLIG